ncbi:MAG: hypothetical protein WAW41_02130 [Methylobacter sp.]
MNRLYLGKQGIRGRFIKRHFSVFLLSFGLFCFALALTLFLSSTNSAYFWVYEDRRGIIGYYGTDNLAFFVFLDFLLYGGAFLLLLSAVAGTWLSQFICPHCLRVIKLADLKWNCPFCEKEHHASSFSLLIQCSNCSSVLQYISCYYAECMKPIDLFAPYDEKKLEMKRYE